MNKDTTNLQIIGEVDKNEEKGNISVNKLKVVYVNARSIMNKLDELQCIAVEENPDIICITETWAHKDNRCRTEPGELQFSSK